MRVIRGITESRRWPGRYDVQLDDGDAALATLDMIERLGLRVGTVLDEAADALLQEESAAVRVYHRALEMLARQPRSAEDLRRRLLRKKEPTALVDQAIERLRRAGYLDDAQFARHFARSRVAGHGLSVRRIRSELARRGIDRVVADEAVGEALHEEGVDTAAILQEVASRRVRSLTDEEPAVRRRRLTAFLLRRGYAYDEVRAVVDRVLEETGGGEAPGG